jgi:hypothetical protein
MYLAFIFVTPEMFPTIAGIAVIAGVSFFMGLYTGSYGFPVPAPGLTADERKMLAQMYDWLRSEHSLHAFEKQINEDIDAYLADEFRTIDEQFHSHLNNSLQQPWSAEQEAEVIRHLESVPKKKANA